MAIAWPVGVLFLGLSPRYLAATVAAASGRSRSRGWSSRSRGRRMATEQIAISSLDWSLAGAVLYALLPDSWNITFFHFLGVFLFAQVAGLLSKVPAGLGVFESMMVLLLPPELPHPQLLAAMVAFRGVYYFLPLLVAAVSLGGHEVVRRREQVGGSPACSAAGRRTWCRRSSPSPPSWAAPSC